MRRTVRNLALLALATSPAAVAEGARPFAAPAAAAPAPAGGVGGLLQVTLALALVLACVFAFAWLVRRARGFGQRGTAALDVVAQVALGAKERAVLVRVGRRQLLVGVAPGQVNLLHVLDEPVESTDPATAAPGGPGPSGAGTAGSGRPSFRDQLLKSLGK